MGPDQTARLRRAEEALRVLADYRSRFAKLPAYAADARAHDVVERNVQIAVQALIDLSDALIASRRWGRPLTAVESVDLLVGHGVLPPGLGTASRRWIRMRNVLVHEYAAIDDGKVHHALKQHLGFLRSALMRLAVAHGLNP